MARIPGVIYHPQDERRIRPTYGMTIDGHEAYGGGSGSWQYADVPGAYDKVLASATRLAETLDQQDAARDRVMALTAKGRLKVRSDVEAAGYKPGWHGEGVWVGDTVVIHARGGWRRGLVYKVTPTKVYAWVSTPSAPDLLTSATGDRTGDHSNLYIQPGLVEEV